MSCRPGSVVAVLNIFCLLAALSACSSPSSTTSTPPPVPLILTIQPSPETSMEVGKTVAFTAAPQNGTSAITETVGYQSSNTAVVTIASNGFACAGSWDSLTNPTICNPGPVGTAQITATVDGVSSPPTTVYVHQHVDRITITPVPTATVPVQTCYSKGQTFTYQATAFSRGVDVTSTVGPFTWQAVNTSVVTLNPTTPTSPVAGLLPGQALTTANIPGFTPIFASASGVTSVPFDFNTCPVQSITLEVNGAVPSGPVTVAQGSSQNITVSVVDTRNVTIADVPLTWCSSQPTLVTIGSNCATNTANSVLATGTLAGGATITASCTPPSCNTGISPSLPIYPESTAAVVVTPTGASTAPAGAQAWVTTTDCGLIDGCVSQLVSVAPANGTTPAAVSTPLDLPATPNSLIFNSAGTKAYLGTDRGNLGTKGLMVFDPTVSPATVTQFTAVAGKVLTVSPDGNKVILSDTAETPNQVFVFDTTVNSSVALRIRGATAAAFSPDSLKAFIVAGSTLYVYSKLDALETIPLNAPASDAAFLASGTLGYLAGGDPAGGAFRATCDDPTSPVASSVSVPGAAVIRALPDGKTMLTLSPPNIQTFTATISGVPALGVSGCPAPRGFLTVTNTPGTAVNLGQGNFTPKQLIISPDSGTAYLLASDRTSIMLFNIVNRTTLPLALAGNAGPVQASLAPDGSKLFVAASDGAVHVVDTVINSDIQQITFPQNLAALQGGLCHNVNFVCNPELIAVRP